MCQSPYGYKPKIAWNGSVAASHATATGMPSTVTEGLRIAAETSPCGSSIADGSFHPQRARLVVAHADSASRGRRTTAERLRCMVCLRRLAVWHRLARSVGCRSEEHTSELQSRE